MHPELKIQKAKLLAESCQIRRDIQETTAAYKPIVNGIGLAWKIIRLFSHLTRSLT
jgi:transposase